MIKNCFQSTGKNSFDDFVFRTRLRVDAFRIESWPPIGRGQVFSCRMQVIKIERPVSLTGLPGF